MPLSYSGKVDFTFLNDYNQAANLFCKPSVGKKIKAKVAENTVDRLISLVDKIHTLDPEWLEKKCEAKTKSGKDYNALINARALLDELKLIRKEIKNLNLDSNLNFNRADLESILDINISLHEKLIILKENNLNRTFKNSTLQTIETVAAVGSVLSGVVAIFSLATGGVLAGAGYASGASQVSKAGSTMLNVSAKAGSASFASSIVSGLASVAQDPEQDSVQSITL